MIKIILFILFLTTSASAGNYVNSASWNNVKTAYNSCSFMGFLCSMNFEKIRAQRQAVSVGDLMIIYSRNKEIDRFKVRRIFYDNNTGQCWISKENKNKFKHYFVTSSCRGR